MLKEKKDVLKVFGLTIKTEGWNKQNKLPLYISELFEIKNANILDKRCLLLIPINELGTISALKKQISRIKSVDNVEIILKLNNLSNYRKEVLIENKIPFITNKQVFIPFLGAILCDKDEDEYTFDKFTYSAQILFLFCLYNNSKQLYISNISKLLPFTAMTLSRAVKQLETTGLFVVKKDGVNIVVEKKFVGLSLYNEAIKYLSTPVLKTGYIRKGKITKGMKLAYDSALANKTMLNVPKIDTYAIYHKDIDKNLISDEFIEQDKQVRIQLWAYNPSLFSNNQYVDDVSLALSYKGDNDERIQGEVEKLLERRFND